jgi:2-oxoisovalerate dehydrogenase E1 component alpha subunit
VTEAASRARNGGAPTLIEAQVERYLPHTSDDDDTRYRPREEIEEARLRDPLKLFGERLMAMGILDNAASEHIYSEARAEVNAVTDYVEAAEYPVTDDFFEHVYAI